MTVCGESWFKNGEKLAMFPAKALINRFCSNGNGEGERKSLAGIVFLLLCFSFSLHALNSCYDLGAIPQQQYFSWSSKERSFLNGYFAHLPNTLG